MKRLEVVVIGILLFLFAVALSSTLLWSDDVAWLQTYGPNVVTELAGIVLTVGFIEWIVSRERERERGKLASVAATRISAPVANLLSLCGAMIKASLPAAPSPPVESYQQLFASDLTAELRFLDFSAPAPVFPSRTWARWVRESLGEIQKDLSSELQKYSTFLPFSALAALENVSSSSFLSLLTQAEFVITQGPVDPRLLYDVSVTSSREEFFSGLLTAVAELNSLGAAKPLSLRSEHWASTSIAPQFGVSRRVRLDLPPDTHNDTPKLDSGSLEPVTSARSRPA